MIQRKSGEFHATAVDLAWQPNFHQRFKNRQAIRTGEERSAADAGKPPNADALSDGIQRFIEGNHGKIVAT